MPHPPHPPHTARPHPLGRHAAAGCLLLVLAGTVATADVVAKYTFDGRTGKTRTVRLHSATPPYNGEDYIPNPNAGECGPTLENPGPGGENWNYYRSYYNHDASDESRGRQTLELQQHHSFFLDSYRTRDGEGTLPAQGSFTWELVIRIDAYDGCNHYGMILDASKGAGRIPNYPGDGGNRAIVTRLWMDEKKDGKFPLHFSVPTDAENRAVTVTTELSLGQWYHLAAVYDDATHKAMLYVDGALAASADAVSCGDRATGFGIGGFGPDVFRVDHPFHLQKAWLDALAFTNDARGPGTFVLPTDTAPAAPNAK